jgi:hypothetical protein
VKVIPFESPIFGAFEFWVGVLRVFCVLSSPSFISSLSDSDDHDDGVASPATCNALPIKPPPLPIHNQHILRCLTLHHCNKGWSEVLIHMPCQLRHRLRTFGIDFGLGLSMVGAVWGIWLAGSSLVGAAVKAPKIRSERI